MVSAGGCGLFLNLSVALLPTWGRGKIFLGIYIIAQWE